MKSHCEIIAENLSKSRMELGLRFNGVDEGVCSDDGGTCQALPESVTPFEIERPRFP
jgi:hypothetical protein